MDEIKFVLKCLIVTCLLFAGSQYRANGLTIESRVESYLVSSPVANFVNESAHGAVKLFSMAKAEVTHYVGKSSGERARPAQPKQRNIDTEDIDLE